jgi:hypothetical protein
MCVSRALWRVVVVLAFGLGLTAPAAAAPRPASAALEHGPVGWEAYRQLDRLPFLTPGSRTRQVSSRDPTGANDDGYSGKYSCLRHVPEGCLLASHDGPGELDQIWSAGYAPVFNPVFRYGPGDLSLVGKLRVVLDGRVVVDAPLQDIASGRTGGVFVRPLVLDAAQSSGGYSISVPMPFRHSMRVTTSENPHYFHVVYRVFRSAGGVRAFASGRESRDVVRTLRIAGTRDPKPRMGPTTMQRSTFSLNAGETKLLASVGGPGALTRLRLRFRQLGSGFSTTPTRAAIDALRNVRLHISFDGERTVDAPVGEFFGSGVGPARVRSLMFAMDPGSTGWMTSWWPMPFRRVAKVGLVNLSRTTIRIGEAAVTSARSARWRAALGGGGDAGLFHANGPRGPTNDGHDWTFLAVNGAGKFLGVSHTMEGQDPPYYLEGNEAGTVDHAQRPQLLGTGTEDFYLGAWYFLDRAFTLPFSGYPLGRERGPGCPAATCKAAYRLMIIDAVPFARSLRYSIQHGPKNNMDAIYGSTAYWYQRPARHSGG